MIQISIELCDYGWFATLPFSTYVQASIYVPLFKIDWKEVEIKNKGNGWIIRYRGRKKHAN